MNITFLQYQNLLMGFDYFLNENRIYRWELYLKKVDAEMLLSDRTIYTKKIKKR